MAFLSLFCQLCFYIFIFPSVLYLFLSVFLSFVPSFIFPHFFFWCFFIVVFFCFFPLLFASNSFLFSLFLGLYSGLVHLLSSSPSLPFLWHESWQQVLSVCLYRSESQNIACRALWWLASQPSDDKQNYILTSASGRPLHRMLQVFRCFDITAVVIFKLWGFETLFICSGHFDGENAVIGQKKTGAVQQGATISGHRLSWQGFFVVFLSPGKCQDGT